MLRAREFVKESRSSNVVRRAIVLANRKARNTAAKVDEACERLHEHGIALTVVYPETIEAMNTAALSGARSADAVIVAGGDGTIRALLESAIRLTVPLGILPVGTANDFARTLGISDRIPEACAVISAGVRRRVDVASVNGHYYLNTAAVGLPAEIASRTNATLKRRFAMFAHVAAGLQFVPNIRSFTIELETLEELFTVRAAALVVGNGKYDGGFPIRYSAVTDGRLNIAACRIDSPVDVLRLLKAIVTKRLQRYNGIWQFEASTLEVRTRAPHRICADGDLVTQTPATFRIHPNALEVLTP